MTSTPRQPSRLDPDIAALLKRDADGLVAAIAQQHDTGEVLMLGWMDDEALHRTLTTGRCTYWSRSRQEYWAKGDTSGHVQHVKSVALDCDADVVLVKVDQVGAACHTGTRTCFDAGVLPLGGPTAGHPGSARTAADARTADDGGGVPAHLPDPADLADPPDPAPPADPAHPAARPHLAQQVRASRQGQ